MFVRTHNINNNHNLNNNINNNNNHNYNNKLLLLSFAVFVAFTLTNLTFAHFVAIC